MNKQINLDSLMDVFSVQEETLTYSFLKVVDNSFSYEKNSGMKDYELEGLHLFSKNLSPYLSMAQKSGYFLSYSINVGMREEFDVLRFSEDIVLNIELKKTFPKNGLEKIKNQLQRHSYLLSTLNKKVIACTFVSDTNELYLLEQKDNESSLKIISLSTLAQLIPQQYSYTNELEDVDFTNIIISPYSEPDRFKKHQYFLTDEQKDIHKEILEAKENIRCIVGGPGTGKSLVLLDLAREFTKQNKKVCLVFCGILNDYDYISQAIGVNILPIKYVNPEILNQQDIILVDEAQRLRVNQFNSLMNRENQIIIFSTDHNQTLHSAEKKLNIEGKLSNTSGVKVKRLKEKIRTDAQMSSFIQKLLNPSASKLQPFEYTNVDAVYYSTMEKAYEFIETKCTNESFISIELTEYRTPLYNLKRSMIYQNSLNSHQVIGKEFDNVLVPIDKYFTYDEENKLVSTYKNFEGHYPYSEPSCIFEALTRVRKKLLIVVIDNPQIFHKIQEILSWKNDTLYSKL